jgi:hypothetical protein
VATWGWFLRSIPKIVAALERHVIFITLNAGRGHCRHVRTGGDPAAVERLLVFAGVVAPGWSLANFTAGLDRHLHRWAPGPASSRPSVRHLVFRSPSKARP